MGIEHSATHFTLFCTKYFRDTEIYVLFSTVQHFQASRWETISITTGSLPLSQPQTSDTDQNSEPDPRSHLAVEGEVGRH